MQSVVIMNKKQFKYCVNLKYIHIYIYIYIWNGYRLIYSNIDVCVNHNKDNIYDSLQSSVARSFNDETIEIMDKKILKLQ